MNEQAIIEMLKKQEQTLSKIEKSLPLHNNTRVEHRANR